MKLVRYRGGNAETYGALVNSRVTCLPELAARKNKKLPATLDEFIASGEEGIQTAEKLLENEADAKNAQLIGQTVLSAPVACPPKIVCLGLNYRDHAAEQNAPIPEEPIIFIKPRTAIIGPNERIIKPSFVKQLDYEAELAIVVGSKARNVSVSEARSRVFGYTILNDVSARDIQFKDKQWTRGKSFDTFASIGPNITTANQLEDTSDLPIHTWVNKELRQNSTTRNMVFNAHEIVHHLSRVMTLEPCDIIATGTPAGVGFAMKPHPKFLQAGDIVKIEIGSIGILQNAVAQERT